jgi:hypothetical protein
MTTPFRQLVLQTLLIIVSMKPDEKPSSGGVACSGAQNYAF